MNKKQYRKEMLRQMEIQNEHLSYIETSLTVIAVFVIALVIIVIWQNCSIGDIEKYVYKLYTSDIPRILGVLEGLT